MINLMSLHILRGASADPCEMNKTLNGESSFSALVLSLLITLAFCLSSIVAIHL